MKRHDVAILAAVVLWLGSFAVTVSVPAVRLDPTLNLVLMGVVGGLVAFR